MFGTSFWTKGSGKRLRGNRDAQLVGAYLISCGTANLIGLYYLPLVTLCHELGMGRDEALAALEFCATSGFAHYDVDAELVWVPNMAQHEIGATMAPKDKRRQVVLRELKAFADHPFGAAFLTRYGLPYGLTESVQDAQLSTGQKGHPRNAEGASAQQDAPGEALPCIGSDQGGVGGLSPSPEDASVAEERKPAMARYAEAYADGQVDASGAPFPPPTAKWDHGALARFTQTPGWGMGLRGGELLRAIYAWSRDFRRACDDRPKAHRNFSPEGCEEWARGSGWRHKPPRMPQERRSPPEPPSEPIPRVNAAEALQDVEVLFGKAAV